MQLGTPRARGPLAPAGGHSKRDSPLLAKIWGWEGHGRPGPGEGRRDSTAFSLVEAILEERLGLGLAPQAAAPEPGPGKALSLPSFILSSLYLGLGIPAML